VSTLTLILTRFFRPRWCLATTARRLVALSPSDGRGLTLLYRAARTRGIRRTRATFSRRVLEMRLYPDDRAHYARCLAALAQQGPLDAPPRPISSWRWWRPCSRLKPLDAHAAGAHTGAARLAGGSTRTVPTRSVRAGPGVRGPTSSVRSHRATSPGAGDRAHACPGAGRHTTSTYEFRCARATTAARSAGSGAPVR
jgi:hypothetical protein